MNPEHKNLLLIGPVPEPKGGVSIHITRLKSLLKNDLIIKYIDESPVRKPDIFNLRSINILEYVNLLRWSHIVHIHSSITLFRLIHILTARLLGKRSVVTLHSFATRSRRNMFLNRIMLKLVDEIVVVNRDIPEILRLKKYRVKPAFLPPSLESEAELPETIKNWLATQRNKNKVILATNAFRIDFLNGTDVYGVDLCIDAMEKLIKIHHANICLIFIIASHAKSLEIYNHYQKLISDKELSESMLLIKEDLSFVKLICECDVVLRPTCTDGDALTIREALYLNKPVIASDVVTRPAGTILFKNRDSSDLALTIMNTISISQNTSPSHEEKHKEFYMHLYGDNNFTDYTSP